MIDADAGDPLSSANNGVLVTVSVGTTVDSSPYSSVRASGVVDAHLAGKKTLGWIGRGLSLQQGNVVNVVVDHNGHPFWDSTRLHMTAVRTVGGAVATSVRLSWHDESSDESGFRIERRTGAGAFAPIAAVGANVTTYRDDSATAGVTYEYQVVATGTLGDSTPSGTLTVTTPALPPRELQAAPATAGAVALSWQIQGPGATGFRVERRELTAPFATVGSLGAGATTFTDTTAPVVSALEYRVVATNAGGDSAPSNIALLADQAAGQWPFDEGTGTLAHDVSGNGNDGVLGSFMGWSTSGVLGGSLTVPSGLDSVRVNRSASLEPTSAITVAIWARVTDSVPFAYCDLVRKTIPAPPAAGYLLRWSHRDSVLQFRIDRLNNPPIYAVDTQSNAAYLGAWHHYAGVYDSAQGVARLYVDGVERKSVSGAGPLEHTDDLFLLGQTYGGHASPPGRADDARIYGRALDAWEIQRLAGW